MITNWDNETPTPAVAYQANTPGRPPARRDSARSGAEYPASQHPPQTSFLFTLSRGVKTRSGQIGSEGSSQLCSHLPPWLAASRGGKYRRRSLRKAADYLRDLVGLVPELVAPYAVPAVCVHRADPPFGRLDLHALALVVALGLEDHRQAVRKLHEEVREILVVPSAMQVGDGEAEPLVLHEGYDVGRVVEVVGGR
jgi:hypothetical protein